MKIQDFCLALNTPNLVESKVMKVYLNPGSGKYYLELPETKSERDIQIYNSLGEIILERMKKKILNYNLTQAINHRVSISSRQFLAIKSSEEKL